MREPQPKDYEVSTRKPSRWAAVGSWVSSVTTNSLLLLLVGGYLAYQYGLNTQVQLTGKQKRQQAYSELMGQKILVAQLTYSHFTAFALFEYYQRRLQLEGWDTETLMFREAQRYMHKSDDLALEVTKSKKDLYGTLGLIRSYFPASPKLKELTQRIYSYSFFQFFQLKERPSQLNNEQLDSWRDDIMKEVEEKTEKEFMKPVDELLNYLEAEIDKEAG